MFGRRRRRELREAALTHFEDGVKVGERRVMHDYVASAVQTARELEDAGFTRDSAVAAAVSGDLTRLKHTGLVCQRLSPPTPTDPGKRSA